LADALGKAAATIATGSAAGHVATDTTGATKEGVFAKMSKVAHSQSLKKLGRSVVELEVFRDW
jgi:hypothetical protein